LATETSIHGDGDIKACWTRNREVGFPVFVVAP